jgi:hypothetical protein
MEGYEMMNSLSLVSRHAIGSVISLQGILVSKVMFMKNLQC